MAPRKKQTKAGQEAMDQPSGVKALKTLFSDWEEDDLQAVLQELDNDFDAAVARISQGYAQQWSSVSKKAKQKPTQKTETETPKETKREESNGGNTGSTGGSGRGRGRGGSSAGGRGGSSARGGKSDRPEGQSSPSKENLSLTRNVSKPVSLPTVSLPKPEELTTNPAPRSAPVTNSWNNPTPPWTQSNWDQSKSSKTSVSLSPSTATTTVTTSLASASSLSSNSEAQTKSQGKEAANTQTDSLKVQHIPGTVIPAVPRPLSPLMPMSAATSSSIPVSNSTLAPKSSIPQAISSQNSSSTASPSASSDTVSSESAPLKPIAPFSLEDMEKMREHFHPHSAGNAPAPASGTGNNAGNFTKSPISPHKEPASTSPVVLPHNAAVQGLNLSFGTLNLGNDELNQTSISPNLTPNQSNNSTEKKSENVEQPDGAQGDMLSFMQNPHIGYGMPGMHLGYGFYDGVDMSFQQRMMYYDPAFQHSQSNFQGKPPFGKGDSPNAPTSQQNQQNQQNQQQAYPHMQQGMGYPPFFPYYPMGQFPYQQGMGYPGFPPNKNVYVYPGQQQQGQQPQQSQKGGNQNASNVNPSNQFGAFPGPGFHPYGGFNLDDASNQPQHQGQQSSQTQSNSNNPASTQSNSNSASGSSQATLAAGQSQAQPASTLPGQSGANSQSGSIQPGQVPQQKSIPPPQQSQQPKYSGFGKPPGLDHPGYKGQQPYDNRQRTGNYYGNNNPNSAYSYPSQNYQQQQQQQQQQQYWRQ